MHDALGFYIDSSGIVRAVTDCPDPPFDSDADAGIFANRLLRRMKHDSLREGWDLFYVEGDVFQVQKDDEARGVCEDDAVAVAAARALFTGLAGREKEKS